MVERVERSVGVASRIGAAALVALCSACASVSDPGGFAVVAQDKFDFASCPEIVGNRAALGQREKQLTDLIAKAETAPVGALVGYTAYRSELTQTRALIAAANRGAQKNNCDLSKK